jgi:type II secretory pathway component GspD/PulD (secretin)
MSARSVLVVAAMVAVWLSQPLDVHARAGDLDRVISFSAKDLEIRGIVQALGQLGDVNVLVDPKVRGRMAFNVKDVTVADALYLVAGITGNRIATIRGVVVFAQEDTIKFMQGPGRVALLRLKYAKAEDVAGVINKIFQKDASAIHNAPTNHLIVTPK